MLKSTTGTFFMELRVSRNCLKFGDCMKLGVTGKKRNMYMRKLYTFTATRTRADGRTLIKVTAACYFQ